MERTLLILKPDTVDRKIVGKILAQVEASPLRLVRLELVRLTPERARSFYAEHEGKPFLGELVAYMTSGPCLPVVLEGEGAVASLRKLLGATNPQNADPGTIRNTFGIDIQTNSVHGSDSPTSAAREIRFFFPDEM
ncbi:MAG TPA: nucleoside-diphosphate kinase [Candidatus Eisenbacteria bacterium]|nr:nucleoside-diphosphate kinase [Candidatus Eisenbacteria bacterium]